MKTTSGRITENGKQGKFSITTLLKLEQFLLKSFYDLLTIWFPIKTKLDRNSKQTTHKTESQVGYFLVSKKFNENDNSRITDMHTWLLWIIKYGFQVATNKNSIYEWRLDLQNKVWIFYRWNYAEFLLWMEWNPATMPVVV